MTRRRSWCFRHVRVVEVEKIEKSTRPSVVSGAAGRVPVDELGADAGSQHPAAGAQAHVDLVVERRQQGGQAGLAHPVGEERRVAAVDQEGGGLAGQGIQSSSPMLSSAVSSSTPTDIQPSWVIGARSSSPPITRRAIAAARLSPTSDTFRPLRPGRPLRCRSGRPALGRSQNGGPGARRNDERVGGQRSDGGR